MLDVQSRELCTYIGIRKLTGRWMERVGPDAAGNEERHQGNDEQDERYQFHDCILLNLFMSFTDEGTRHLLLKT
uniref:Uncharacterized protein n=1 Tax=Trichogramma kaykai TaxID=54128 RepID=A0ABD2VYE6_9HYME